MGHGNIFEGMVIFWRGMVIYWWGMAIFLWGMAIFLWGMCRMSTLRLIILKTTGQSENELLTVNCFLVSLCECAC